MFRCKLSTGVVWRAAIDSPGYSSKAESRPLFASALLVVHIKTHFCRARNVPKSSYSRLHSAGIVVFVVAQPIQNMSAVSITHKTLGIRLPRLWCGAGLVWPGPTDHPNRCHLLSPSCTWRGWAAVASRSFRVCDENGAKAYRRD
jgi:hypothetical protein